jgi:hypothetical protein
VSHVGEMLLWQATRLQDEDSVLTPDERYDALEAAAFEYSDRYPRTRVQDYTGDGTTTTFTIPTGWVTDWSTILAIEVPQGEWPPVYWAKTLYGLYQTPTVLQLRFLSALGNGIVARVSYTAPHVLTLEGTSVGLSSLPLPHQRPVATLGAAIAAEWIATRYAAQSDTTLGVDTADHADRSRNFGARAARLREVFDMLLPRRVQTRLVIARA